MKRRDLLKTAAFFAITLAAANNLTASERADKPNIVYMMLDADEFTLGQMFKSAGYATGGFGKWGTFS